MQLLKILLIISHLLTFSSASFGSLRGANEHVASKNGGEAADDNELGRPAKEAAVMIAGSGGGFKIRSVIANNTVQDEEVSDITLGKFPRSAHSGYIHGTMVGPRHMLTASHCINFGSDHGLLPTFFAPSYDEGNAPFGLFECEKVYFLVLPDTDGDRYVSDHEAAFDYAVCVLDEYPQTGHMGSRVYDSAWNGKPLWNHIGYPEDYDLDGEIPNPIFSQNGTVLDTQTHIVDKSSLFPGTGEIEGYLLSTNIDAESGQSGGPVYAHWEGDDGGYYVIAVMSASSPMKTVVAGGPGLVFLINSALEDYPWTVHLDAGTSSGNTIVCLEIRKGNYFGI